MELKKISDDLYTAKLDENEHKIINDMIDTLSKNKTNKYDLNLNKHLFNTMLSRYVASEFFNRGLDVTDFGFVLVDTLVEHNGQQEIVKISLGQVELEELTYVNGVMYK